MENTAKIVAILAVTALANLVFAGFLWRRYGFIRQVRVLLVLTAVLLVNVAIWAVRASGGAARPESAAWSAR